MLFTIVTLFPDIFPGALGYGLSGRSLGKLWNLKTVDIRDFATDRHKTVDDTPYGGGAGMIMKPEIVHSAMGHALSFYKSGHPKIIFMSPRGKTFTQQIAKELMSNTECDGFIILCGRYEGVDERLIQYWKKHHGMVELSIGDYILFGGEIPALAIIDTCLRLIPGIMNNSESTEVESFSSNLLEYPQYTRPISWMDEGVPPVLVSGNHGEIEKWRLTQAEQITKENRPDLWEKHISK